MFFGFFLWRFGFYVRHACLLKYTFHFCDFLFGSSFQRLRWSNTCHQQAQIFLISLACLYDLHDLPAIYNGDPVGKSQDFVQFR